MSSTGEMIKNKHKVYFRELFAADLIYRDWNRGS